MRRLFKTTIVIWTEYDPTNIVEIDDLARDAISGESYCSSSESVLVEDPEKDTDWDGTEFFGADEQENKEAENE
jgi:hypothetical protein